jgi:predicted GNAT family N-acyltransferase
MSVTRIVRLPKNATQPGKASTAYLLCLEIRRKVFIDGQAVPAEIEFDGLDDEAQHFLAYRHDDSDEDPVALGTARMRIVGAVAKAERVAVLAEARGLGIGRALMESIELYGRREGLSSIRLNAQIQAADFYQKMGYLAEGEIFVEAGIDHRQMTKQIS